MDPLNDPRFPRRPQHEDFWRLVEVINQLDGQSKEAGRTLPDILAEMVDPESLEYVVNQRSTHPALAALVGPLPPHLVAYAQGQMLNWFAIGYLYAQRYGR